MTTRIASLLFSAAAATILVPSAQATDLPKRKSGLWEVTARTENRGSITMQVCIDQKQDDLNGKQGPDARKTCPDVTVKRTATGYVIDSVCKFDGTTGNGHTVVNGDMNRQYDMDATMTFTPPLHGISKTHSFMTGKWLGPCKPGQKNGSYTIMGMPGANNMQITPETMRQMQEMQKKYGQ